MREQESNVCAYLSEKAILLRLNPCFQVPARGILHHDVEHLLFVRTPVREEVGCANEGKEA
jgi:hypothetical protein